MNRLALAALLSLAACDGRVDPQLVDEATPDGGVQAIKSALSVPNPTIASGIHFRMHFNYDPTGDTDLRSASGPMEVYPVLYPPVSIANHYRNGWHGYPDIASFSPVSSVYFEAWGQNPNNPSGPWVRWIAAHANCTLSLAPYASFVTTLGVSGVECDADVQSPILISNNQIYVMWDPDCPNGNMQSQWAYESAMNNDQRISYSASTNWLTLTTSHGGPYFDRAYWQQMSIQCMPSSSSMWSHPGSWHDPIWESFIGPPFLASDWGPFTWN
jgi:hypothetical protein